MNPRPSAALSTEGGAHDNPTIERLRLRPLLPDPKILRDRRLIAIFDRHARVGPGRQVLEAGCGGSPWLAYLARERRCLVTGIEIDPHAARRAEANLAGAGSRGEILVRDAFDVASNPELLGRFDLVYSMGVLEHLANPVDGLLALAAYLRPGGRVLTTVPNLRGWNGMIQYLGSVDELEMHEIYDLPRLAWIHDCAGFEHLASGYVGFFDGYLSSASGAPDGLRRRIHRFVCHATGTAAETWARATAGRLAPETSLLSPHLFYVGTL
jgi:SAM-dependent methyltransferase